MDDIPEEALRTIEETFGTRFARHADGEAETDAGQLFASVFPENAAEVESLTKLAARHRIPLIARGAGTALNPGRAPRALAVRFDAMREIRIPESGEDWVEVEPGVPWMVLQERLRERGIGPTVYPTSAPRSTVGGWLAENGFGVGSFEHGWLLQNVLSLEAVQAGGERNLIEGETLRYFVGSRGSMGFLVRARDPTCRRGRARGGGFSGRGGSRGGCLGSLSGRCAALAPWLPERRHGPCQGPRGKTRALRRLPGGEGAVGRICS